MARQSPVITAMERLDAIVAATDGELATAAASVAAELLAIGETALEGWVRSRAMTPSTETVEGFRLLALHRQGARGEPSFNACRETCRELVYLLNCVTLAPDSAEGPRQLRLAAMVARHLVLFIDGKLETAGLGEFCCSSRPLRHAEAASTAAGTS
jgi:hypothetical protein